MDSLTKLLEANGPYSTAGDYITARAMWKEVQSEHGFAGTAHLLTAPESNLKLHKTGYAESQYATVYGLTLAPADMSGIDACIWRSPECTKACVLVTAGNSTFPVVRRARIAKTLFLRDHPQHFMVLLARELQTAVAKHGPIACRLNVASDLRWERIAPALFDLPGVTFYDYTKAPASQRSTLDGRYHLTFSVSEKKHSEAEALQWLERGDSVAVVFNTKRTASLPETWRGYRVIDGDVTDARHYDAPSVVVGLRAKGSARGMATGGFVKEGVAS